MDALADRIGNPELVVCLDSGCGNYEQLWSTTSLRGVVGAVLTVRVLEEGVHSGDASGIVPCSFRVLRRLLSRLEDEVTGEVRVVAAHVPIADERRDQARAAARVLGDGVHARFPFADAAGPVSRDGAELVLNRTWRPALAVTGQDGLPALADAGNVLRPATAVKLSLRLPPGADLEACRREVETALTADPPAGCRIDIEWDHPAPGWNAPAVAPWLERATEDASRAAFGRPAVYMGEGGTIPFMAMLGDRFPRSQFLVTGVLGPQSNAHGPNEFLHIPTAKKVTLSVAHVLDAHARRPAGE